METESWPNAPVTIENSKRKENAGIFII